MIKKIVLIVCLFLTGLLVLYQGGSPGPKNVDVYLLFDKSTDMPLIDCWTGMDTNMPEDFDFSRTRIEPNQLQKLDVLQRKIYDSIIDDYYATPRKVVYDSPNGRLYSISLNYGELIQFQKLDSGFVKKGKIADLNLISLDSAIAIIAPELSVPDKDQDGAFDIIYDFHIIDMDPSLDEFPVYTSKPGHMLIH